MSSHKHIQYMCLHACFEYFVTLKYVVISLPTNATNIGSPALTLTLHYCMQLQRLENQYDNAGQ